MPNERVEQPVADPAQVAETTRRFLELHARDATAFAEALADNVMEPDLVETAAFRSEELAFYSLAATRYLIENARSVLARRRRASTEKARTEGFMQKVGHERRLLELRVNGIRAEKGMLPNAPNPRQRAMRRLASENMAADVPKGRFRQLFDEEVEVDKQRKRDAKKQRQQERREQRR
jgi:hypothetical protein